MKQIYGLMLAFIASSVSYAQIDLGAGTFSGGIESTSQWYQTDEDLGFEQPNDPFRSNNYIRLDYNYGKFSAGLQYEAYLPSALLGYSDRFNDNKIATYYVNYKGEHLDITAGNFYEQFGSGMVLRSWEDRQIGINNSIRGVRVAYTPNDFTTIKGLIGKPRLGFETTEGTVGGLDIETNIVRLFDKENYSNSVTAGFSYVGQQENYTGAIEDFPQSTNNYSARLGYSGNSGVYINAEYVYKSERPSFFSQVPTEQYYDGNGLLVNLGYSTKGFGINTTFRRLENMGIFAQRSLSEPAENLFNEGIVNYLPALTRQHDYLLTNIYVYQSQPNINFIEKEAGEIGGQLDIYYNMPKGTLLGGKYGTKLAANASYWNGLNAEFNEAGTEYTTNFFDFGRKFFHDVNFEVNKKWTDKFSSIITYMHQYYDKAIVEGGNYSHIIANVVVGDFLYKFNPKNSVRFELQHLQTKRDRKNWAAALVEYNLNQRWNFYVGDNYNYGNDDEEERFHYYMVGGSYAKESTRVSMNYGRQRGGLICVGGVCRYVPENTGFTLTLVKTF
ncbi:DUF6029 family protein [Moheibacter sediminis]|uniref:Uncharacterized protein n=1 Tax=Moheibacter sediminis TaxID=1434700 RepID=A0A1W2CGU9_9FLAO|nr:DUF6029 family protein [Moheibacter sediminis]SMC84391.1 hypothetical protein SAMN06296427_11063 [Moheibacter sediminis]